MSSSNKKKSLNWKDVASAGDRIFNVWAGNPELRWAKTAWHKLQKAGLTVFESELEKHTVLCRLLVLGELYHDFCCMAWDECGGVDYAYMAEGLELDDFILGRLYERLPGANEEDEEPSDALEYIADAERSTVVSALLDGFGEDGLYESLLNSRRGQDEVAGEDFSAEDDDPMMRAQDWISQKCLRL